MQPKLKIELPKDWNSVTIDQFQKLSKVKQDDVDGLDSMVEMISILSGIERQRLYDISFVDLTRIWNVLGWVSEPKFSDKIVPEFTIKDVVYEANLDVKQMTAGQLIDLKHFLKDGAGVDNMHNILAIFYIPNGKKYNEVSISEVAETFQTELSVSIAYPLQVFFCKRLSKWKDLTNHSIKESLMKRSKRELRHLLQRNKTSMNAGVGL
jgi:hypothetical protein